MKKESVIPRIITVVLAVLLCAYIGYQAYRALYNPVRTVSAVYTEVDDAVQMDGVVVRDERVMVKNYGSGVLEMNMYEGERVANGSAVAVVFANEDAARKSHEAAEIDEQIERMTALYSQSGESYDINAANDRISEYAISLVRMQQEPVSENTDTAVEELKLSTLMREYIYRDKAELLEVIEQLRAERAKLGNAAAVKSRIYASAAGYFSQYADGYEEVMTPSLVLTSPISEFISTGEKYATPDKNAVGKLVSSNIWYFAATVDEKSAARFSEGAEMTLKFNDKALPQVTGEVVRLTEPEGGRVLVVFECNTHIGSFTKVRKTSARAVVKTYSGLKVPREALRVSEEGINGVYCLIDSQVKFKPVDIIFEKDSYYVSAYDTADTKSLLLYDEIVVSAKNLENKKIVK
ncbi:MAG: hypothetical protein IJB42_03490 [Oscillospiraceae bacterium]|nr:hypothetical protein [Oscillospiraceae bacterium]MBQ3224752.1 hypothetical protein [Oscillospiraceae bacterium]MBR2181182.1 hypothetical protein [Oscillospiraceae bacterium]